MTDTDYSLTSALKLYLEGEVDTYYPNQLVAGDTDSILSKSNEAGLTLREYVKQNPNKAIMEAEASYNEWHSYA